MSSRKLPLFILNKGEWFLFWNAISGFKAFGLSISEMFITSGDLAIAPWY